MTSVRNQSVLFLLAVLGAEASCSSEPKPDAGLSSSTDAVSPAVGRTVLAESGSASLRIAEIRALTRSPIGNAHRTRFEGRVGETHLHAVASAESSQGVARRASVRLPRRAADAVELEDLTSRISLAFALEGMAGAGLEVADGLALYESGYRGSADVVHRVTAGGTEDFVVFWRRPARSELTYDVDVSRVAGLRLVSNTLEFLDESGSPQLRVAPPYVVDAAGARSEARLSVTACAVDGDPRAPWGRPVTRAGADRCKLHVAWSTGLAYPAVVDPSWTATGAMGTPRFDHIAALLPSGKVLVAGGGSGGSYLASAELYDPAAATFAATGAMKAARTGHTVNVLASGKALVAGGRDAPGAHATAELYDPAVGTFAFTGAMLQAHEVHTATLLASGKVLVAGGIDGSSVLATAELYDPVTSLFTAAGPMATGREHFTASVLPSGKVLVVGGTSGAFGFSSAELFDPATQTFSPTGGLTAGRFFHRATVMSSGKVLVTGGINQPNYLASAEIYDPATAMFSVTGAMADARQGHSSVLLLPSGKVLVAAGANSNGNLDTAELFDPTTGIFSATGTLSLPRGGNSATRLTSGKILVAGGGTTSAELFLVLAGGACSAAADCAAGVCQADRQPADR